MTYFIHADKFFLENVTETGGYLEIDDNGNFGFYYSENKKPDGKIIDYVGKYVAPGLVDTHIHGLLNEDVMKSDWDGINKISEGLLQAGVTSWVPTTITDSSDRLINICEKFAKHKGEETGAKILGLHFEGPYFTEKHAGAENTKYMCDPSIDELHKFRVASDNMLIKMSIAPERKGAKEFVRKAVKSGVIISLGHSASNFADAIACVEAGASMFCHTYNGMEPMSQHSPNLLGAAFSARLVTDELICDGHHVLQPTIRALIQAKGVEHICLITDCMQAGMMPDGDYVLGELPVYVEKGMARLKTKGNSLAGSVLLLKQAVENLVNWNIATPEDAIMMASYVPAMSIGKLAQCGSIKPDKPADFIVLNKDMTLCETYLNGVLRYKNKEQVN